MDFGSWFRDWLLRHPLKELPSYNSAQYTEEVMSRIRALNHAPSQVTAPSIVERLLRPLPFAFAAAGALVLIITISHLRANTQQLEASIDKSVAVLDEINNGAIAEPILSEEEETTISDEVELSNVIMLAQDQPSDEQLIEEKLKLLDQIGEEPSEYDTDEKNSPASNDNWFDELLLFDENELAANS